MEKWKHDQWSAMGAVRQFRGLGLILCVSALSACGGGSNSNGNEPGFFLQVESPFFEQEPGHTRTFEAFSHNADGQNLAPQPIAFLENPDGNRLQYFDPSPANRRNFSIVETNRSEFDGKVFVNISVNSFIGLPDGRYSFRASNNQPASACEARERGVAIGSLPPQAEEVAAASTFGGRGAGDCCSEQSPEQLIIEPIIVCESALAQPEQRAIFASAHSFNLFDDDFEPTSFQQARYGLLTDINAGQDDPIPLPLSQPYSTRRYQLESAVDIQSVFAFVRSDLGSLSLRTAPSKPDTSDFFDYAGEALELVAPWEAGLLRFQPFIFIDFAGTGGRSLLIRPSPMQAPVPMNQIITVPAAPFDGLLLDARTFRSFGWTRTVNSTPGTALLQLFVVSGAVDADGRDVEQFFTWNIAFDPEVFDRLSLPALPALAEVLQAPQGRVSAKLFQFAYADGRGFDQFWTRSPTVNLGGLAVKGVSLGIEPGGEREQDLNLETILDQGANSVYTEFFPTPTDDPDKFGSRQ